MLLKMPPQINCIFLASVSGTCVIQIWDTGFIWYTGNGTSTAAGYNTLYGHLGKSSSMSLSANLIFSARDFHSRCICYEKLSPVCQKMKSILALVSGS